jgi:hypothetical protein
MADLQGHVDIANARLIRELLVDLGGIAEGVGVILYLVDQRYGVRRTLIEYVNRFALHQKPNVRAAALRRLC